MKDHQVIKNNILPGDILLSREADSLATEVVEGRIRTRWDKLDFYVPNKTILEDGRDYGIFRAKSGMSSLKRKLLVLLFNLMCFWAKLTMKKVRGLTPRIAGKAYRLLGWKIQRHITSPSDFDESENIVRIV